MTLQGFDL